MLVFTLMSVYADRLLPARIVRGGQAAATVWPQGWSFFDRIADDDTVVVYRVATGSGPERATPIQMSAAGRWGFGRAAIREVVETRDIVERVPADKWTDCGTAEPAACLSAAAGGDRLRMNARIAAPTLCGALVVSVEAPQRATPAFRSTKVVGVDVRCAAR